MKNEIKIFSNSQFGEIRTATTENGEPLFCLSDLCQSLNTKNATQVTQRLDKDEVTILNIGGLSGATNFVTESGMYTVILRSNSPLAKPMQKWVTSEVLPSIRKTGGYIQTTESDTPELIMARALIVAQSAIEKHAHAITLLQSENRVLESKNSSQEILLDEQAPRVRFSNAVEGAVNSCLVGELAKLLNQNGIEIGQNRLFIWLRENHYLGQKGEFYNIPTQRAMDSGWFEIKLTERTHGNGTTIIQKTAKITGKGQIYFVNKFITAKLLTSQKVA